VAAAEMAISSPLLEASIDGAHGVLMNVSGGSDLGLFEINEAAQLVADAAHPEANIIFGAVIDDALGDEVRVTVIAAGFDGGAPRARAAEPRRAQIREPEAVDEEVDETVDLVAAEEPTHVRVQEPVRPAVTQRPQPPRRTIVFDDNDDLDVPDFLK
jgi:cell division protein FtsZ